MKITKDELLIRLAKLMFYVDPRNSVAGDFDFLHKLKVEFEEVEAIYNSLWKDELEIEGYERSEWTKFDPNDTATFPPKNGKRIIVAYEQSTNSNKWEVFVEPSTNYLIQFLRTDLPNINVYWRPLPQPPKE